jgi:integrase/recombinase XerD
MNNIIKTNNDLSIPKKRRRNRDNNGTIFSIYKSEKTLKDYMYHLTDFLKYVYEFDGNLKPEETMKMMNSIEKEDIEDYIKHLIDERKLKKTSINKSLSSLKSLYKELEKNGYENPFKYIPLFKTAKHNLDNVLRLSYEDLKDIIINFKITDDKSYRDLVILYTLFYTGLRSSELLNLKYEDIIERQGSIVLKLRETKSGKEQYKPLHDECYKKLMEYKTYISKLYNLHVEDMVGDFIFPTSFSPNIKMSYNNLYRIIKDKGLLIGKEISPHNIRHTVATELSLRGADILEIRDFLGHADTKVTEVYINAKNILEKRAITKLPKLI